MIELTYIEKNLYNTYLRVSRTERNKPFSPRKDFTDFDDKDAINTKRINSMLYKYPHILPEEYFKAPFKIYPNEEYFALEYFAGMGAVNSYTMYMKQIQEMDPDSDEQLNFIKRSLQFIGTFCIKNKIQLAEYPTHKTGVTFDWMKQLKRHEISVYSLMEFTDVYKTITEVGEDEKELFLGEVGNFFHSYKTKYLKSQTAMYLVQEGLKKIEKIINTKM